MSKETRETIEVDRLVPGLFVDLEVSWTKHPFLFSRFKIATTKDIAVIKHMGLKQVVVIPERSEIDIPTAVAPEQKEKAAEIHNEFLMQKRLQLEEAQKYRDRRIEVAKHYKHKAKMVQNVTKNLKSNPANAVRDADKVVDSLVEDFDGEAGLMTNLVNLDGSEHTMYNHSVNVTVLSMMMGTALGLNADELKNLGMGALLHDVGKTEIPSRILLKKEKLTNAEALLLQRHTTFGRNLSDRVQRLPPSVRDIIEHHHEFLDGKGYPHQLQGDKVQPLTRIVALANVYDNLCNPTLLASAMTPKNALAVMYTKYKDKIDTELLQHFIQTMGVYPPGTIVRLSDGSVALVVTADPDDLLRPEILLYNPEIPKDQALIIDLKKNTDLVIKDVLRKGDYPARMFEYLNIQDRIGYFVEKKK